MIRYLRRYWFTILIFIFALLGGPIGIVTIWRWIKTGIWDYALFR